MGLLPVFFQRVAMTEVTPLVLALLVCMLGQVTRGQRFCGVDSRPHPKGLCGDMLIRARRNLCFLLSADYPNLFNRRSMHKRSILNHANLDDFSVHTFAEMDLHGEHPDLGQLDQSASSENVRKLFQSLFPRVQTLIPDLGSSSSSSSSSMLNQRPGGKAGAEEDDDLPATKRAHADLLPRIQKRGMVCDCCYNVCQASTLAQYC